MNWNYLWGFLIGSFYVMVADWLSSDRRDCRDWRDHVASVIFALLWPVWIPAAAIAKFIRWSKS